jgi:hypothetical protein
VLVSSLIKGAMRKIGALASGQEPEPSEAQEALDMLRQYYLEMVGAGTFGRQADVFVPSSAADFTANENRRYTAESLREVGIALPETVSDSWWRWTPSYGELWRPPVTTATEPSNDQRPPLDGALVTASDLSYGTTRTFVYDAALGKWTSLQDLDLGDQGPLSTRYAEGLMCELAVRLSSEYGGDPPIAVVRGAAQGRSAMVNKFDGPERQGVGIFM